MINNSYPETKNNIKKDTPSKKIKVKFNVSLANPDYNLKKVIDLVEEKKNTQIYFFQRQIDYNTADAFFEAGKIYDIPWEFYEKISKRTFKTYNPSIGQFNSEIDKSGNEVTSSKVKRLEIPYVLKVNEEGEIIDRWELENQDLYPRKR